jgi:hypothetical protein
MAYPKKLIPFILLFFTLFASFAQQGEKLVSLKSILESISQKEHIKFNYIDEEIVIFKLIPPPDSDKLTAKISYIENVTHLNIKKIGNDYYSIYNKRELDKPLCGIVIDSENGLPIDNVNVRITDTKVSSITNSKGYFQLPVVSPNTIEINHVSYEPLLINPLDLYVADCPKIKLKQLTKTLQEVVTQRYLTSGIYKKNDGSILIKPYKFGLLPGLIEPDVLQTIQQIPGINSVDETISNINVRGGTHDQNLFLWNGIRMFQTGHFFGLISAFNPSLAQSISVAKNGSSAFYGEGVSSTIDITSHSKFNEEIHNSISTNLISAEFFSKVKLTNKSNFTISGRRSLTDFFSSPTYSNYKDKVFQNTIITNLNSNQNIDFTSREKFYFYDITAQYEQQIGKKNTLYVDAISIKNNLFVNQYTLATSKNSNLSQQNYGGSINWKTNWTNTNYSQVHAYISSYALTSKNESLESNQLLNQENKVLAFGVQLKNSHQITKSIAINEGYQFDETGVTNFDEVNLPFFSRKTIQVLKSHVAIGEGSYESENKETLLKVGVRANYFEKFKTFLIEPRLQFNQALTSNIRLEVLGEQKSQTLSQVIDLQQDFLGIEKRRWTLANDSSIPIQKSNQISLGFSFKNNSWLITLDNFYKKITGITSNGQGFQNQYEFINTKGDYQILGTEVLVQKGFGKFYTWVSYSYNDNKYLFKTLTPTQFLNNFELKHCVSWAGIYEWNSVKIALGCKWHTGKPFTEPTTTTVTSSNPVIEYQKPNSYQLPDFFQLNISASKDWKFGKNSSLQTSISVLNLLNTKNCINRYYRINNKDNTIESVNSYALNITPNVNIKWTF